MTEQEAKQEAQRIVNKYNFYNISPLEQIECALLEVQSNIDLLDKLFKKQFNLGHQSITILIEIENLKQVKAQIELL